MGRIIIDNRTDMPDVEAFAYVERVMKDGRISNYDTQYCYATTWSDGVYVLSRLNKCSDSFVVGKLEKERDNGKK